ncbi:unnamed protein product [Vicia faba]|uniref:Uncharacterized protein n=1 Tax=Vicia faba TaxID=3906 RepID=A0AAV0ZAD2_VICFA|nr:unnamed protein product [Vicia faba]
MRVNELIPTLSSERVFIALSAGPRSSMLGHDEVQQRRLSGLTCVWSPACGLLPGQLLRENRCWTRDSRRTVMMTIWTRGQRLPCEHVGKCPTVSSLGCMSLGLGQSTCLRQRL